MMLARMAGRHAGRAPLLAVGLLLSGCGGGQPAQPARFVPPAPAVADLHGPLRAHYNLLPTLALGEAVAREYGIERREGSALLMVALRKPLPGGDEGPAEGEVQAWAQDLSGRRQAVAMRTVSTGHYVDHIGVLATGAHDVIRVDVAVRSGGREQRFDFQRSF